MYPKQNSDKTLTEINQYSRAISRESNTGQTNYRRMPVGFQPNQIQSKNNYKDQDNQNDDDHTKDTKKEESNDNSNVHRPGDESK